MQRSIAVHLWIGPGYLSTCALKDLLTLRVQWWRSWHRTSCAAAANQMCSSGIERSS